MAEDFIGLSLSIKSIFFVFFYGTNVINITERNAFILIKIYSKATLSSGCQACVTIIISLNIKNIALNKI